MKTNFWITRDHLPRNPRSEWISILTDYPSTKYDSHTGQMQWDSRDELFGETYDSLLYYGAEFVFGTLPESGEAIHVVNGNIVAKLNLSEM